MRVFILTRRRLAALGAALALIVCIGLIGAHSGDAAVPANAGVRSIPIYSVQTDEKKVSLSFDAAWGNEQTQTLLDTLAKYKVKSTFFLVGDWVKNYPDDVKKIYDAGHDVGNHSNTHPYMTQLDSAAIRQEIESCNSKVKDITGTAPTLFRPPYGDYNNSVVDTVNSMGMYCVQWTIDSLDWQDPSPSEILEKVKNNLAPGAIILMHNGAKNTPEALPSVIEYIQSQGYEIVPISQLLPKGTYKTDANGMMIPDEKPCSDTDKSVQTAAEITSSNTSSITSSNTSNITSSNTSNITSSNTSSMAASSRTETTSSYHGLAEELLEKTESKKMKK